MGCGCGILLMSIGGLCLVFAFPFGAIPGAILILAGVLACGLSKLWK